MQNAIGAYTAKPRRKKYLFHRVERHASPTFHDAGRGEAKSRHENGRDNEATGQKKKKEEEEEEKKKERKKKREKNGRRREEKPKKAKTVRIHGPRGRGNNRQQ